MSGTRRSKIASSSSVNARPRICLWRGTADHRHPEHAPAQDAEDRDQLHQALGCPQPGLLGPTARLEDLVEHLDLPAKRIPAQLLDRLRASRDGQIGDQLPVDGGPISRRIALAGMDDGEREGGIALLLADRGEHADAAESKLHIRSTDSPFWSRTSTRCTPWTSTSAIFRSKVSGDDIRLANPFICEEAISRFRIGPVLARQRNTGSRHPFARSAGAALQPSACP